MDAKSFLNIVCERIKYKPVRAGISEELEQHINDIKEDYIDKGMEEKQAEEKAVLQMGDAEEIGKNLNKIHKPRLDWKLIILIVILTSFSFVVAIIKRNSNVGIPVSIGNAIVYLLLGVIISIGIYFFDYRKLKKHSGLIYLIATIIMLLSVLPGISFIINGTMYATIFNVSFPVATVALPLYLISFIGFIMSDREDDIVKIQFASKELKINKKSIRIMILSIISLLLMIFNISTANMLVLATAYIIISTVKIVKDKEERTIKLVFIYCGVLIITTLSILFMFLQQSYRWERIKGFINPEADPDGSGYVQMLQRETVQKAKVFGEAENMSIPIDESILNTESNYTFIYLIGKCGVVVAGIVAVTVVLASIRLILNAKNIREQYGKYLVIGLSSLFILESFATIFMNVSLGIQLDVNLPFVTYGGVYFILNIVNIAIILSVYRRKDISMFEKENS